MKSKNNLSDKIEQITWFKIFYLKHMLQNGSNGLK